MCVFNFNRGDLEPHKKRKEPNAHLTVLVAARHYVRLAARLLISSATNPEDRHASVSTILPHALQAEPEGGRELLADTKL